MHYALCNKPHISSYKTPFTKYIFDKRICVKWMFVVTLCDCIWKWKSPRALANHKTEPVFFFAGTSPSLQPSLKIFTLLPTKFSAQAPMVRSGPVSITSPGKYVTNHKNDWCIFLFVVYRMADKKTERQATKILRTLHTCSV